MSLVQKMWQRAGVAFRAKVGKELASHGLLYEDVLVETEEVPAALPCLQLGLALVQPRPPLHIPPSPRSRAPVAVPSGPPSPPATSRPQNSLLQVKLALSRLPKDVMNAREIRLKRAMVLSSQQKRLPPEVVAMQDPWKPYLAPYLEAITAEKEEMASLGISDGKSNLIGK